MFWLLFLAEAGVEIFTSSSPLLGGGVGNEKGKSCCGWASDACSLWCACSERSMPAKLGAWLLNGKVVNCSFNRSRSSRCCWAKASVTSCGGESSRYFVGGDRGNSSVCLSSSSECGVEFDWKFKGKKCQPCVCRAHKRKLPNFAADKTVKRKASIMEFVSFAQYSNSRPSGLQESKSLYCFTIASNDSALRQCRKQREPRFGGTLAAFKGITAPSSPAPLSREGLPRDYFIICLRDTFGHAKTLFLWFKATYHRWVIVREAFVTFHLHRFSINFRKNQFNQQGNKRASFPVTVNEVLWWNSNELCRRAPKGINFRPDHDTRGYQLAINPQINRNSNKLFVRAPHEILKTRNLFCSLILYQLLST